jgi:DNA-binding transcriptional ArsR family regulator
MSPAKLGLGIFVLAFLIAIPQLGAASPQRTTIGLTPTTNLETKVLTDSKGAVHIIWTVPSSNSSGSTPGLWYSKYSPNGTDSIPPTLIKNSSLVQSADMALDRFDRPHIVWTESSALVNNSLSRVNSNLYYGVVNSTDLRHFASTSLISVDKLVIWPSLTIDDNLTSYLVWTQLDMKSKLMGGTYYDKVGAANIVDQPTLIASYNQSLISVPRPRVAFDQVSEDLHIAWVENDQLSGGQVVSRVQYAQVDLRTGNITRLQVATFGERSGDASVALGTTGDTYIIWQQNLAPTTERVYVAQISGNARLIFLKEIPQPAIPASGPQRIVSADSQDNLYVVWYQPGAGPTQRLSPSNDTRTSVAFLKLDRDGLVSQSGSELVVGPLIAVTVSMSGDMYAISHQGIVRVTTITNALNVGLIGVAVASALGTAGALTIEEARYRMLRSVAPIARSLKRKQKENSQIKKCEILKILSRRPGLALRELSKQVRQERVTMIKLALLERDGYVSSTRTGLARRFYTRGQQDSRDGPILMSTYEAVPSQILHEIEHNPGIWEARLAKNLGLSQQIVHYHLRKLQATGILRAEPQARRKRYWLRGSSYEGNPDS